MKLYIVAPENFASGGPELLHQLAYEIKKRGIETYMYYFPSGNNAIHDNYKNYGISYAKNIDDDENNFLIVPEVYTNFLWKYKKIKKIIWWLSVDFYFIAGNNFIKNNLNSFLLNKFNCQNYFFFDKKLLDKDIMHLYQSEYARKFLVNKNIKLMYPLSDFLYESYLKNVFLNDVERKKRIVVYYPVKGLYFTKKIIKAASDIKFLPIINMTREEVVDLLNSSMVYIDFGYHPGKDRIPREAAILGNCIITSLKGSANNHLDINISERYKFKDNNSELSNIVLTIEECLDDYIQRSHDFDEYRRSILKEKEKFEGEVDTIISLMFDSSNNS